VSIVRTIGEKANSSESEAVFSGHLPGLEKTAAFEVGVRFLFELEVNIKMALNNAVEVSMKNSFAICVWIGVAFLRA
jgi:hypothetical protein